MVKYLNGYASFGKMILDDGINIDGSLTLLSDEQLWGKDNEEQLEVIKKNGPISAVTDLCILTGCCLKDIDGYRVSNDNSLQGRYGFDWTKSSSKNNNISIVIQCNLSSFAYPNESNGVIRPVLQTFNYFDNIVKNRFSSSDDIQEIEFGEYPQYAVNPVMQNLLEMQYQGGIIQSSGNSYTFGGTETYLANKYKEYIYEGKKYIRIKASFDDSGKSFLDNLNDEFRLSNGIRYKTGDYVWVEVSPIVWLIDEKKRLLISKKGLVSGIKYLNKDNYDGDFNKTEIKKYLDNFMFHEIVQNISKQELNMEDYSIHTEQVHKRIR